MSAELSQILSHMEVPCKISEDREKGKGMVALKGMKGNTVLFEEIPIVSWSFSTRPSGTYCDWCLQTLSTEEDSKEYRCEEGVKDPKNNSCIAVYCSEDCQQRAAVSHKFLCGETLSAIRNFDLHELLNGPNNNNNSDDDDDGKQNKKTDIESEDYQPPTGDGLPITLEALAKAVCTVATRYLAFSQQYPAGTSAAELFPLAAQMFNRLVSAPGDVEFDEINTSAWFDTIRKLLADKMLRIFIEVLGTEDERRHKEIVKVLFSDETLGVMLGQLTLNSQALNLPVPKQTRRNREEDDDNDNDNGSGKKSMIRPSVGAAVFALHSTLNHSCDPNAFVVFTQNHEIAVKLKKAVLPGEEITITYIAELYLKLENYEQRRERLSNYFFKCSCARCLKEEKEEKEKKERKNNSSGGEVKEDAAVGNENCKTTEDRERSCSEETI